MRSNEDILNELVPDGMCKQAQRGLKRAFENYVDKWYEGDMGPSDWAELRYLLENLHISHPDVNIDVVDQIVQGTYDAEQGASTGAKDALVYLLEDL